MAFNACINKLLFFSCFSVFNFLVNFGIAVTYPLFIALGTVVGIPLNAGKIDKHWLITVISVM